MSLVLFLILTVFLISALVFTTSPKRANVIDLSGSNWSTRELNEDPIKLNFLDSDQVDFIIGEDGMRRFSFEIEDDLLTVFDEEGDIKFEWNFLKEGNSLTLRNDKDVLKFYRTE